MNKKNGRLGILKISILSLISTLVKVLSALVINKAISVYIGPSGLAVIGQFQNLSVIIQNAANGGINNGVIKYTAEGQHRGEFKSIFSTSLKLTIILSIIASVIMMIFSNYMSFLFFGDGSFTYVFIVFGVTLTLFSINQLLLAIISGLSEVRLFISISVIQSLYSLIFTALLVYFFSLDGALIAMVTNQSIVLFIMLWMLKGHDVIKFENFLGKIERSQLIGLFKYSMMALVSAITVPLSLIVIRDYIRSDISWEYAGYWQAMTYISSIGLMVVTTILSIYYLPRISEVKCRAEIFKEMFSIFRVIFPIAVFFAFLVYFSRFYIVDILFSSDFSHMIVLFKWQLFGDVIRVLACLLSYIMLAKAMTRTFIATEIISSTLFVVLSILCINAFGFIGVSYAYAIANILYLSVMIIVMWCYFRSNSFSID
ncbi:O-antigen translocase [Vibrio sp. S17_S38]|uniref:O-antigen translocase n=1 Tax=Vibrio sp. S17_S38 TaxID=2720229 RepID=UPI0016818709|nr:O-antigen translocase [Vibrio sp. S17_S38]MBD1573268.1 O-antigen translocase [Vibrio sp. S17_S38]